MGTKFRGIVVPSDNPDIRKTFDSITPKVPMYLTKVSDELLGVGFLFLYPEQNEFNRIGCLLSQVTGSAAFYWCHSAVGDGFTLYENGKVVEKIHDEYGGLGNLPFRGATYDDLVNAFCCRISKVLSRSYCHRFVE